MSLRYAIMARRHWQDHRPAQNEQLTDPEAFFRELGEQAQVQIEELTDTLAGPDPENETFLAKVSRISQARHAAEGTVLREFLLPAPEDSNDPEDDTGDGAEQELADALAEFRRLRDQFYDEIDRAAESDW